MIKNKLTVGFRIRTKAESAWHEMTLPGSAMDVYVRDGVIPDPYVGTNEYAVREFFENDFVIEGEFPVSPEQMRKEHLHLVFYGIDTIADLYVNEVWIGHVSDMHRTYRFDVKELVREGRNSLRIEIESPLRFIREFEPAPGCAHRFANTGTNPGFQYARKASSMYGWDWGPQIPDAGIWRDAVLEAFDGFRLGDTRVHQEHDDGIVRLDFLTTVYKENMPGEDSWNSTCGQPDNQAGGQSAATDRFAVEVPVTGMQSAPMLTYRVESPDGTLLYEGTDPHAEIDEPLLWWPHGQGEQPLYRVTVSLHSGEEEQNDSFRIGLRTVTVSREKDQWGEEFCFKVNGQKIFAMGADYIPQDCFYTHVTDEVLERDVKAAAFANFNCLRIWGGGYFQADRFYDLCDEYGILIWQDLLFACGAYELYPQFEKDIVAETTDNVRRIRNHACLALICGNNELESGWTDWATMKDLPKRLRKDYLVMTEYLLAGVVRKEAPDTFWWPSSPSSGGSLDAPSDESRGDVHYWDVWHGLLPMSAYEEHYFRFLSEFGFQSLPDRKTLRSFAQGEELNLFSEVMESHQKNPAANGKIMSYLSANFRYPKDLDSIGYLSQVLQGIAMKTAVDHLRRNRGRCMGSIYWQFNDNWPVLSWASMDYYGRFKVLHYMARRFFAPVSASIQENGMNRTFWICNESAAAVKVEMKVTLRSLDFEVLDEKNLSFTLKPYTSAAAASKDYSSLTKGREKDVFLAAEYFVADEKGNPVCSGREYSLFAPYKYLNLRDPRIEVTAEEDGSLTLRAKSFAPLCFVENMDSDTVWDDNAVTFTDDAPLTLRYHAGGYHAGDRIDVCDMWHTYH